MSRSKRPSGPTQADYLGAWIEAPAPQPAAQAPSPARERQQPRREAKAKPRRQAQRPAEPGRRQRITTYLDAELYAEARGAAILLAANGLEPGTVAGLVEEGLARELERLRQRHNGGKPFPALPGLPGGRPRRG